MKSLALVCFFFSVFMLAQEQQITDPVMREKHLKASQYSAQQEYSQETPVKDVLQEMQISERAHHHEYKIAEPPASVYNQPHSYHIANVKETWQTERKDPTSAASYSRSRPEEQTKPRNYRMTPTQ